jgi:hypothetical protein
VQAERKAKLCVYGGPKTSTCKPRCILCRRPSSFLGVLSEEVPDQKMMGWLGDTSCYRDRPLSTKQKQEVLGRTNRLLSFDTTRTTTENDASNNSSIVAFGFVGAVTFLPSRCLETIEGYTCRHKD